MAYIPSYTPDHSPTDRGYRSHAYGPAELGSYSFPLMGRSEPGRSASSYLDQLTHYLDPPSQSAYARGEQADKGEDVVSAILNRQIARRALASSQLVELIQERRKMAQKHIADIDFRLEDVRSQLSILSMIHGPLAHKETGTVERRLLDLERQKRQVQRQLWQDTAELEQNLLEQRSDYVTAKRRMEMLQGGSDGP